MSVTRTLDEELSEFAASVGAVDPVVMVGGRTRADLGGAVDPGAREIGAPIGVVEYQPAEMTVRVRAGTPVRELHEHLAEAGQRTALPERGGTVGGALAVGENHLDVLGRGTVRDAVLQVRYVSAEGEVVSAGGAVVKNVTGYNLPKLMVGSLGTLGFIGEAVLRTNPIPESSVWLRADDTDPLRVFDALLRPAAVLWDAASTWAHLEGYAADLDHERAMLGDLGTFVEVDGPPALPDHRWSLTPADAAAFGSRDVNDFVASIGVGTVHADIPQPHRTVDPVHAEVAARAKSLFDPTGRLNPGRRAGG